MNIYEQPLKNTLCGDEDKNEDDTLIYNGDNTHHDKDNETENNDTALLTGDIKELKLGKMSSHSEIDYNNKLSDKINWIGDNNNTNSGERYQIRERHSC